MAIRAGRALRGMLRTEAGGGFDALGDGLVGELPEEAAASDIDPRRWVDFLESLCGWSVIGTLSYETTGCIVWWNRLRHSSTDCGGCCSASRERLCLFPCQYFQ